MTRLVRDYVRAGGGNAAAARGEEPDDREKDAGRDAGATGAESYKHRAHRAQGSYGH